MQYLLQQLGEVGIAVLHWIAMIATAPFNDVLPDICLIAMAIGLTYAIFKLLFRH